MDEIMTFPDTWEEFEKSYGFTDNEEVYTNGARLIPSFRVKQWLDHILSAQKPFKLPKIFVAEGFDTIEDEGGNIGFGVYAPAENQIYVVGDVEVEIRARALLHEVCHWVQAMCGRPFDEDEANEFSDIVYDALPSIQPDVSDTNVGDINKFIDGLEEIFADLRERHGDDSVCGLCEYDGAYIGQSGDWCNECPGFDRDDCFKLSDKCRKRWIDTITNSMLPVQPRKGKWLPDNTNYYDERYICSECNANYKVDTCMGKPSWNFCPNCGSYNGGEDNVPESIT